MLTLVVCLWVAIQGVLTLVQSWPAYAAILRATASQHHGALLIAMAPILGLAGLIALAWATFIRILFRRTRGLARVFIALVLGVALWVLSAGAASSPWEWVAGAALLALFVALLWPQRNAHRST